MPKVSIILPSYNHAIFLKDRLDSIINQIYSDWELIIIDDKSTDSSLEILTDFVENNKERVKYFIINETNSGSGYKSWQKGIELSDSEYIWIAETDDYSDIYFLSEQIHVLEKNKECVLSFCSSNLVDEQNKIISSTEKRTKSLSVDHNEYKVFEGKAFLEKMPLETYINNGSSVVFRKPSVEIPAIIFSYRQSSDIFLWTFLLTNSSFAFINKKMNFFRRHENSTTTILSNSKAILGTYKEVIVYIAYFNYPEKSINIINHYFNNYIWKNKREMFNFEVFRNDKKLKNLYLKKLLPLTLKKIFNGK
ncbi:Glycosyltransferase involved in cell wall bisynthesis [Flavobacterium swingsii]|jgi:glycosyltransferase involved in cell wall biosynthesis|uniref:Glycosyltransferase involved in cell wall bisynthesis n=1 Tax=Flavobacterium swingsii TaxID=498292 RepID=A0A1I0Z605_9FLAO|nr:glycosyltransferase family A protein [Flavobacterium swingsii]SFB21045.1 Glycosyltransferase involved in cell wall bisynthesis [Flavobacterium swingsii]